MGLPTLSIPVVWACSDACDGSGSSAEVVLKDEGTGVNVWGIDALLVLKVGIVGDGVRLLERLSTETPSPPRVNLFLVVVGEERSESLLALELP